MRLGQLARKYGVSQQEIISQLKKMDPSYDKLGHNTKLNEQALVWLASRLEKSEDLISSSIESDNLINQVTLEEIEPEQQSEEISESPAETSDELIEEAADEELPPKEEVVIETDKLLELLESEDTPVDISKITLIKAPKRELDGLKVVGKIDLPEPRAKRSEKTALSSDQVKPGKKGGKQHRPLTEEEREKRRLKAKRRKEEFEAREEKRRRAKEKQRKKTINRARYQQKLQRAKTSVPKIPPPSQEEPSFQESAPPSPPPKTMLGKFWRWLNTP